MMRTPLITLTVLGLAGTAFAHTGVKNMIVKARMDAMSAIGADMKTLGQMAKGATAFDRDRARSAAASIAKHAADTPALFEADEDDPKSEAKAEIWDDFADFTAKSKSLEALALELSASIAAGSDLAPAIKSLGGACQACHKVYREEK
ncbi:c-type cytochrome [Roseobacter sp. EG26]|uniref:c-type cytochrome n=1 Tax=Roseobacter sp. EG26 TaxID=3412477 RepID=UPI003CE4BFA8